MRHFAALGLGFVLAMTQASSVRAAFAPYPTPGVENPVKYTFTAVSTGTITAYFAGSTAAFENELGMSVNGGAVSTFGLDNHTTAYGTPFNLGSVTAGDSIV